MDALCRDASGNPYRLDPHVDFLARAADPALRGDVQGCGKLNPVVVFSKDEDRRLSRDENHPERDARNLPNRRVLVFLFPPGAAADLQRWPCPAAAEGPAQCRTQLWPDGDARRTPGAEPRVYGPTRDTMARPTG